MTSAQDTILLILTVSAWFVMGWLAFWILEFINTAEKNVKNYIRLRYGQRPYLEALAAYSSLVIIVSLYLSPIVIVGALYFAMDADLPFRKVMVKIGFTSWIIGSFLRVIWKRMRH